MSRLLWRYSESWQSRLAHLRHFNLEEEEKAMEEAVSQGGEFIIGIAAALAVIGAVMLLLGQTDAGMLRIYLTHVLEAAC